MLDKYGVMKTREKNAAVKGYINRFTLMGKDKPFWKALAQDLNRPRSIRREVNLTRLDLHCKPKESVVVPGIVLASGKITKPLTVFALKFSKTAEEKIKEAGGSCSSLDSLLDKQPKTLRIIG